MKMQIKQNVLDATFSHFIKHQKKYLVLLAVLILLLHFAANYLAGKPLLSGAESYYHLYSAREWIDFNPLSAVLSLFPDSVVFLLPLLLAVISILLLLAIAQKIGLTERVAFFFTLFLILSPTFLFAFTTLSSYSFFLFLVLLGFFLLMQEQKILRYLSLLPFILAAGFDIFSTAFLLVLLLIYRSVTHDKKDPVSLAGIGTTAVLFVATLILKFPLLLGPFHRQQLVSDLVSDFGGLSGISAFILLLAIIGMLSTWKKKNFYHLYLLLPLIIPAYIFNTNIIFYLSLIIVVFAAISFVQMFERRWNLISLKHFTMIILLLGVIFSTITYLDRFSNYGPSHDDKDALIWIKEHTPVNSVVLSAPENSYVIRYFAEREPLRVFEKGTYTEKTELAEAVFSSLYIQDLFPTLEENKVRFLFITKEMKQGLPSDQGFLFLLKNERFKLLYASGDSEVWAFKQENK